MSMTGFPIDASLTRLANNLGGVARPGADFSRKYRLWHRQNIPAGGQTTYTFFNASRQANVTNLEQAGTLPANQVFEVQTMRFNLLTGFDVQGRRLGIEAPTAGELNASALNMLQVGPGLADPLSAPWRWHEWAREILSQGEVRFRIGEREVFSIHGLTAFPDGRGVVTDANATLSLAQSSTSGTAGATGSLILAQVYNGAPTASNRIVFDKRLTIVSGQQISVDVVYGRAISSTIATLGPLNGVTNATVAGVLMCELEGNLTSKTQ
jgi:hypothetical protein